MPSAPKRGGDDLEPSHASGTGAAGHIMRFWPPAEARCRQDDVLGNASGHIPMGRASRQDGTGSSTGLTLAAEFPAAIVSGLGRKSSARAVVDHPDARVIAHPTAPSRSLEPTRRQLCRSSFHP